MSYQPDTLAIHAGQVPDPATNARAVPIYATTSYVFNDTQHAADLFGLRVFGNIYTRIMNPTSDVFEKRIAELEGGIAALARGQRPGGRDAHRAQPGARGRQPGLLADPVRRHLQPVRLHAAQVGHHDAGSWTSTTSTRCAPRSTPAPGCSSSRPSATRGSTCPTSRRWPTIAHEAGIPLVVDNTFGAATLSRPIEHGADIIIHSATKWIGGHGTAIGGVVVDAGKFDWTSDKAQGALPRVQRARPELSRPGLHRGVRPGRVHHQAPGAAAARPRARRSRRSTRSCSCRVSRRCRSASSGTPRTPSPWPSGWPRIPRVEWVSYPGPRDRIPSTGTPPSISPAGSAAC